MERDRPSILCKSFCFLIFPLAVTFAASVSAQVEEETFLESQRHVQLHQLPA